MPGTLPAAGSSAPGAAIPARAPPMLRAASSRAAEEARPGAGTARARRGSAQARLSTSRARRPFPAGSDGTNPGTKMFGSWGSAPPERPARDFQSGAQGAQPLSRPAGGFLPGSARCYFGADACEEWAGLFIVSGAPGSAAPPRRPRPQPTEEAGEGTARVIYCRDSPEPPHPPPQAGGRRQALGAAGARTKKRVPGLCWGTCQPQFSRQWSGNAVFRGCCCLSVPRPAQTARGGHRWPLRGWGARPLGRWSGCSLPERQNALPPDETHGHSLTPV